MLLDKLLTFAYQNKCSDLHLSANLPPIVRLHGDLVPLDHPPISHSELFEMLMGIMSDAQRAYFARELEIDLSYAIPKVSRFRVNAYHQIRGVAAAFRTIPDRVQTLEELATPSNFKDFVMKPRGLVLVTGPTGSGKSTTLAAMVDHRNSIDPCHIITVEDPVEFVHNPKRALISQREVGGHTLSFSNALRVALREDPDVILVGEMRDLETIRLALTAAETGHLVLGTLHTNSAAKSIDRIIDVFPAAEKEMVRSMLSESIIAIISQTLLKRKDGNGRIAAHEIMVGTSAIRNLIRENKIAQIYSAMQTGQSQGMITLDQTLEVLVKRGYISQETARAVAKQPDLFKSPGEASGAPVNLVGGQAGGQAGGVIDSADLAGGNAAGD